MTNTMKKVRLETAADTDVGQVRSTNQDSVRVWALNRAEAPAIAVLLVADGMGGHKDGEVASRLAVEFAGDLLIPWLENLEGSPSQIEVEEIISQAFDKANQAMFQHSESHGIKQGNIGTTLECAVLINNQVYIGHVGDSRIYALTLSGLEQLTMDHSAVAELVYAGMLEPEDIYTHPNRNILTRGLGDGGDIEVDFVERKLSIGERLLLCSDGLWGIVRDPELEKIMLQGVRLDRIVEDLIFAANEAGGDDNIGVVICEVSPG